MPLIDGKYEILSEQQLGPEQTLFEATAPDGAAVRIVWYELEPDQEARFEHYRRTVKRLKRSDRAAVYDVVSRPGAHYVAWHLPVDAKPAAADDELSSALATAGYRAEDADVRRNGRRPILYGLAFDGTSLPATVVPSGPEEARPRARRSAPVPPRWAVTLAATCLLGIIALAFLYAGLTQRANDTLVVVPRVAGAGVNEAAALLHGLGLRVDPVPIGSSEEAGTVLNVEPASGTQLRPGRTVRLSYALPPGAVTPAEVPRVVARRYPEEAAAILEETGLQIGTVARIPAEQAAGLVISQSPAAGTVSYEGATVDLLVSAGPNEQLTFVPDLVGLPVEEARYLARVAGLSPERILEDAVPAGRGDAGTVVAQSLRPNQPVEQGEAVLRLTVARPERNLASNESGLPSFVGLSLEEARELAGSLELTVEQIADRTIPEVVVDQSPPPATEGARELTLVVNVHPLVIPTPDVQANIREPEPRELAFRWFIEPGIPEQLARVYATDLEGNTRLVWVERVEGGESVEGVWRTMVTGPVRFSLTLNDQPYGIDLQAN
ncbi:MAG TPA: PASTA domain-containing protein [Trueperaceae bacterium]